VEPAASIIYLSGEPVPEPSGQVLVKIWALKAWPNKPINGQVQVSKCKFQHISSEIKEWYQRQSVFECVCESACPTENLVNMSQNTMKGISPNFDHRRNLVHRCAD